MDFERPRMRVLLYRLNAFGLQFQVVDLSEVDHGECVGWTFLAIDPQDESDIERWEAWMRASRKNPLE